MRLSVGTVFEQKDAPDVQDLLVRDSLDETIKPGGKKTLKAYGLCMDRDGASPSGEELLLTPWSLDVDLPAPGGARRHEDSQAALWAATDKGDRG